MTLRRLLLALPVVFLAACGDKDEDDSGHEDHDSGEHDHES